MTNILIDRGKRYKIEMCNYCTDYRGRPMPIMPEDMKHARKMEDGSYKCQKCQVIDLLRLNGYGHRWIFSIQLFNTQISQRLWRTGTYNWWWYNSWRPRITH